MTSAPVDRAGAALALGQRIRVQYCTGPYRQVEQDEGVITGIYLGGLVLDGTRYRCVPPNGYRRHDDVEHGHQVWTEILPSPTTEKVI